jgi:hypothetical protein
MYEVFSAILRVWLCKLLNAVLEEVRCLSAHELATLLLLDDAPDAPMAVTPDVITLCEVGLVKLIESEEGEIRFALTAEGSAVLRVLGKRVK